MKPKQLFLLTVFLASLSPKLLAQLKCDSLLTVFEDVLRTANISETELKMECSTNVSNAQFKHNQPVSSIIINPEYFSVHSLTVFVAAICHEIGHFKLKHYVASSDDGLFKQQELLADSICGYYMKKLNFSRPEEAFEVLNTSSTEKGKYPSKDERKESILKGWIKASDENNIIAYASYNPRVIWENKGKYLTIKIDDREILEFTTWYNHGAIYDPLTNSTYQLINYQNKQGAYGIGRIVTNKTNITYRRNGKKGFSIYENGREVTKAVCQATPPILKNDEIDLVYTCWNKKRREYVTYLLKDYRFSPNKHLMPAFTK